MQNETVHAALCVYDPSGNYSQHAGVVITSIFENTDSKVIIHILHDETLTEENRKKFIRTAEKYSQGLEFHDVSEYKNSLDTKNLDFVINRYSIGSLYRLFITDALSELERVIYLDCDIIVDLDILELWKTDINNYFLAGAIDLPGENFNDNLHAEKMRLLLNGCRPETYINAGVLLMNLKRIREKLSLSKAGLEWLSRRRDMAVAADQDALNAIFAGDIKVIDSRFNRNVWASDMSGSIIHMIFCKPWREMRGLQSDRLYWKMFLRSAWGENVTRDELVDILNDAANKMTKSKVTHRKFIRSLLWIRDKTIGHIPMRALRYIKLDILTRMKNIFARR